MSSIYSTITSDRSYRMTTTCASPRSGAAPFDVTRRGSHGTHTNRRLVLVAVMCGALAGCAASSPYGHTKAGAGIGAVAGGILGGIVDKGGAGGVLLGSALGALAGGGVGHYMDRQQAAFERELANEIARHDLQIERLQDDLLRLSLDSEVSFDFAKADLKSAFVPTLDRLGALLVEYHQTVVHVVGHTDSIGSESSNQQLSERRAAAVGTHLGGLGVMPHRILPTGRGELRPRTTNETEAGRQLNRRVDILLRPIVKGQEDRAYMLPQGAV